MTDTVFPDIPKWADRYASSEMAVTNLPDQVRIGPFTFTIRKMRELSDGNSSWGYCSYRGQTIEIQTQLPSVEVAGEVFLHECLHAIHRVYNIKAKRDNAERIVTTTAVGLAALFMDNPWLTTWLYRCCYRT